MSLRPDTTFSTTLRSDASRILIVRGGMLIGDNNKVSQKIQQRCDGSKCCILALLPKNGGEIAMLPLPAHQSHRLAQLQKKNGLNDLYRSLC